MDESTFDLDRSAILAGARRFPVSRAAPRAPDTPGSLRYLARGTAEGFQHHCFDENGHS